jgi:hypothetical protein
MNVSRQCAPILAVTGLGLALAGPVAGQATVPNHLNDKFQLSAALTAVRFTTTIRVDSDEGTGTEIDAESDLGVSRMVPEPRFTLRWGISQRHSLEFGYQFARRNGERDLTREIEYNGETYAAGLFVQTSFDSDLATLVWRWAFHASEKSRIGATLGVGSILFRTSVVGYASVNDQTADVATERNLTAPVGGVGAFGKWRLHPQWYLDVDARGIYVPISRFEAFVLDLGAAVRWFPTTWGGLELGVGFNRVRVDVNEDPEAILTGDFSGRVRYGLAHPRLAAVVTF